MKRRYANPPIVEALCEVYLAEPRWDETVPGRFFDRVQLEGFDQKEPVQRHEAHFSFGGTEGSSAQVRQETRMRFRSSATNRIVQIEPGLLVVNQLPPYPSFDDWAPVVPRMVETLSSLMANEGVERIGLRYINRIDIPASRILLEDWFTVAPRLPTAWADVAGSFVVRAQKQIGASLSMVLTLGSAPAASPDASGFLLDFYAVHDLTRAISVAGLRPLLQEAHDCIEGAFEGGITDSLRGRFQPLSQP